jgi:sulfopyruvate decarboxylase TPP-binding subunit
VSNAQLVADAIAEVADTVICLPDTALLAVDRALAANPGVRFLACEREDLGIATALGMGFTGHTCAVLMEASGLGLSALILARAVLIHAEVLVVASHNFALGERLHYHGATRAVSDPLLRALGIPYHVLGGAAEAAAVLRGLTVTMTGQRTPAALLIPPWVCEDGSP